MAIPEKLPEATEPKNFEREPVSKTLRQQIVAIDPPPKGAIGIEELLGRFERFAEAQALTDLPEKSPIGVRELLTRLGNLADAGYFSPSRSQEDEPEEKTGT